MVSSRKLSTIALAAVMAGLTLGAPAVSGVGCNLVVEETGSFKDADLLYAVAAPDGGEPTIVGAEYFGGQGAPFAITWNGSGWVQYEVPVLQEGALVTLHDAAAASGSQIWAVGTLRADHTEIVRFDGKWERFDSPEAGDGGSQLLGVGAGPAAAWAVGKAVVGGRPGTLIQRWNGKRWQTVASPNAEGADSSVLKDVAYIGPTDAVAVGWSVADGGRFAPLIERWDGGSWRVAESPGVRSDALLTGVAATAHDDVWAVGWTAEPGGATEPLALHWDGSEWTSQELPAIQGEGRLQGVAVTGTGLLAVGDTKGQDRSFRPLAISYDGSGWAAVELPEVDTFDSFLLSAASPRPGEVWIAGTHRGPDGFGSLILRGCAG